MGAIDREPIELRAEGVLAEVDEYVWGERKPPIPVENIADSCFGLHVCDKSPEDLRAAPGCPPLGAEDTLSGLLLPSRMEIWVNAEEAEEWPTRRRFTIAHEVGHWVMHRGQQTLFCRSKGIQPDDEKVEGPDIEEEASIFAASLLMPRDLMRRYWERCGKRHDAMCKIFNCSGAAVGRRLHTAL